MKMFDLQFVVLYLCVAKNQMLQQSVHDAITLNIQCKLLANFPMDFCLIDVRLFSIALDAPEFLDPPLTQFDIVEGQSSSFNQTARGNPPLIEYKWKREDDSDVMATTKGGSTRIVSDGPLLNISKAQRSDSGIYKLYASNELGTSETSIRVNVQCKSQGGLNGFSRLILCPF